MLLLCSAKHYTHRHGCAKHSRTIRVPTATCFAACIGLRTVCGDGIDVVLVLQLSCIRRERRNLHAVLAQVARNLANANSSGTRSHMDSASGSIAVRFAEQLMTARTERAPVCPTSPRQS